MQLQFIPNNSSELYTWKIKRQNKGIGYLHIGDNGTCVILGHTTYLWPEITSIQDAKVVLEQLF